jgi:hypothetical protein
MVYSTRPVSEVQPNTPLQPTRAAEQTTGGGMQGLARLNGQALIWR